MGKGILLHSQGRLRHLLSYLRTLQCNGIPPALSLSPFICWDDWGKLLASKFLTPLGLMSQRVEWRAICQASVTLSPPSSQVVTDSFQFCFILPWRQMFSGVKQDLLGLFIATVTSDRCYVAAFSLAATLSP